METYTGIISEWEFYVYCGHQLLISFVLCWIAWCLTRSRPGSSERVKSNIQIKHVELSGKYTAKRDIKLKLYVRGKHKKSAMSENEMDRQQEQKLVAHKKDIIKSKLNAMDSQSQDPCISNGHEAKFFTKPVESSSLLNPPTGSVTDNPVVLRLYTRGVSGTNIPAELRTASLPRTIQSDITSKLTEVASSEMEIKGNLQDWSLADTDRNDHDDSNTLTFTFNKT